MLDKEDCDDMSKEAENMIKQTVDYLSCCKHLSASQMNIIKYMNMYVTGCRSESNDTKVRRFIYMHVLPMAATTGCTYVPV